MSDDPKQNAPGPTPGAQPPQPPPGRPIETPPAPKAEASPSEPAGPTRVEPTLKAPEPVAPAHIEPAPKAPELEQTAPQAAAPPEPPPARLASAGAGSAPVAPSDADSAAPLEAISRRIAGRLQRTEQALSPWTQQTLRQQRASAPGAGTEPSAQTGTSGPEQTPLALTGARMQSLTQRVQRREEQAAAGSFGGMAAGAQRVDRFSGGVTAHFPAIAAKYEPQPEPENGPTGQPAPAGSGPTFTYYPEGGGPGPTRGGAGSGAAGAGSREPAMSAAEVLRRFGNQQPSANVQRSAATPAGQPAPSAPPQPRPARDIRKLRRFSKIEELPTQGEPETSSSASAAPAAAEPKAPSSPAPRTGRAVEAVPAPVDVPRPTRRVSPDEPPAEPGPQRPAADPAAPAQTGPLRWDHLNNLPPSVQRQLERVQQTLAEETGQTDPQPTAETPRPFHPRNPNPPPTPPVKPTPARPRAMPEAEPPIAFGPDLSPRPAAVQRQPGPPPPVQAQSPSESGRAERQGPVPARSAATVPPVRPAPPLEPPANGLDEPLRTAEAKLVIQRSPEQPDAAKPPLSQQPMPLVGPPAGAEQEPILEATAPQPSSPRPEPTAPLAEPTALLPEPAASSPKPTEVVTPTQPAAPPTPERDIPVPSQVDELPLKRPIAPRTEPVAPAAPIQAKRVEPVINQTRPERPTTKASEIWPENVMAASAPEPAPDATEAVAAQLNELPQEPVVQRTPLTESLAEQPLVLRQPPETPAKVVEPGSGARPAVTELAPETPARVVVQRTGPQPALTESQPTAPRFGSEVPPAPPADALEATPASELAAETPSPTVQRSTTSLRPVEQPLTLRAPTSPARAERLPTPESPQPGKAAGEVAQVQRSPEKPGSPVAQPASPERPESASGPMPEVVPGPTAERVELMVPSVPQPATAAPEVQRSEAHGPAVSQIDDEPVREQPLILREAPPAEPAPASNLTAPGPVAVTPQPKPAVERKLETNIEETLPLVTPPIPTRSQAPSAAGVMPDTPAAPPVIQRRAEYALPESELPLRTAPQIAPEPGGAMVTESAAIPPTKPPAAPLAAPRPAIQRQSEASAAEPPALAMPLRQPPLTSTAPEPADGEEPGTTGPMSLGSQVYARAVRGANMPRVGPLATGARRSIQRQPAASAGSPLEPSTFAGPLVNSLARSSRVATPVLPQARLQRENDNQPELRQSNAPAGTLPLAPPATTIARTTAAQPTLPATARARSASAPAGTLPLAHAAQPSGKKDGTAAKVADKGKDNLLAGLKDGANALDADSDKTKDINLDELADKVLPFVKRLIAIERERQDPI